MHASVLYPWAATALFGVAETHMYLAQPPALGSPQNALTLEKDKDYQFMTSPLKGGPDYPCKHLSLRGTLSGGVVAEWQAGQTFKVIHTWIGGCPGGGPTKFRVPSDAPSGQALSAWSWLNRVGNREFYGNCAVVEVSGGGAGTRDSVAFKDRPAPFVANLGNGCQTVEGSDPLIPDPGPNVDKVGNKFAAPVGSCGAVKSGGGSGGGAGQSPGTPSKPAPGAAPQTPSPDAVAGTEGDGAPASPPDVLPNPRSPGTDAPGSAGQGTGNPSDGEAASSQGGSRPVGYTPGNDWPAGFNAAGRNTRSYALAVAIVLHMMAGWLFG